METIRELLDTKGHEICSVKPDDTVYDALDLMAQKNIGSVIVLSDDGTILGIFSERDYARKIILAGRTSRDTRVSDVMTTAVSSIDPGWSIEKAMALMTEKRIRHLPVLDRDSLVGVISIGDVVKAQIAEKDFLIEQLEHYISGG
jgi:CBS domain-containing protein